MMAALTRSSSSLLSSHHNNINHVVDVEVGESTPLLLSKPYAKNNPVGGAALSSASGAGGCTVVVLPDLRGESFKERLVAVTASVSVITSVLSLLLESSLHPMVWLSSVLGMVLSPLAAVQQCKLTQVEALQETNHVFARQVKELTLENQRLSDSVQALEESVLNLQAMEETLETLQSMEGQSIAELEEQLHDSQAVLAQMQQNVSSELLQNLITVLLACDSDGGGTTNNHHNNNLNNNTNMLLSDEEILDWIHHIESINGVELKEELFRQTIIDHGRSLPAIMEVMRNLLLSTSPHSSNSLPPEQSIFKFVEPAPQNHHHGTAAPSHLNNFGETIKPEVVRPNKILS